MYEKTAAEVSAVFVCFVFLKVGLTGAEAAAEILDALDVVASYCV